MDWKEHTHLVGCIVTNLQALETVLRYFSVRMNGQQVEFPKVGDPDASETDLTSYTFLGTLIDNFNNALTADEQKFKVDKSVVNTRDSIAHGRLLVSGTAPPYRLWRFGRPKGGRVPVEFCEELTVEWLTAASNLIGAQKEKVMTCFKARGYQGLQ